MKVRRKDLDESRKIHATRGNMYYRRFDELAFESLDEALSQKWKHDAHFGMEWTGTLTWEGTVEKMRNGWPLQEELMLKKLEQIELPLALRKPETVKRRKRRRADFGNAVDIHEVNQGRSDRAWERTEHVKLPTVGNKLVHIDINLSAACGVKLEDMLWRGALVLRIYEALIKMGKSVAISGYYAALGLWNTNGGYSVGMVSCKIKDYGEPMSVSKLAPMVHGAFFRCFLMNEGSREHPELGRVCTSGKGYPVDDPELRSSDAAEDEARGGHIVHIGQCFSREQAEFTMAQFIKEYVKGETGDSNTEALQQWRKS